MTSSTKLMMAAGAGDGDTGFYPKTVDNSLRFNALDTAYMTDTLGSGTITKWTCSFWTKLTKPASGTEQRIFNASAGTGQDTGIGVNATGQVFLFTQQSNANYDWLVTTRLLRDPSAWYNIVIVWDSANATAADRQQIYINGTRETSFATDIQPALNATSSINSASLHYIGKYVGATPNLNFDGYLSQFCLIDNQALTPTSFGEDKNGIWVPKNVSGLTFGTNGFYLDFADSAALGNDVSGNNNDFTSSGLTASDQMIDTPTNNFCTLNELSKAGSGIALSEGNMEIGSGGAAHTAVQGTIALTGKHYWEQCFASGQQSKLGIMEATLPITSVSAVPYDIAGLWCIYNGATNIYTGLNGVGAGPTVRAGSLPVAQCAFDADTGKVWFGWNGVWINPNGSTNATADPANGISPTATISSSKILVPVSGGYNSTVNMNFGQDGTFGGVKTAQGNADENGIGDFFYAPPSGYLALCTANLPEPTIGPNSDILPSDVFATVLYTGNGTAIGSGGKAVTGVGFQPDLVIIKNRDVKAQWAWFDSVRGATKYVKSNDELNEVTDTESLSTFDADGFTLGNAVVVNTNTEDYVAYCFKITAGFFDVVSYSGTGSAKTEAHSLGVVPNFIFAIHRDNAGTAKVVYTSGLPVTDPQTDALILSGTNAVIDDPSWWNDTAPTSSVFTVGYNPATNQSAKTYIAYLFADVEGFCKTGYYKGNGSADGTFQYLGFDPSLHVMKRTNGSGRWDTRMPSQYNNQVDNYLRFDSDNEEKSQAGIDGLSNGVKQRGTGLSFNGLDSDYTTLSIGGNTIKYSNAR